MQGTPLSVIDLDLLDSDNELLEEQEVFMIECRGQSLSHKQHGQVIDKLTVTVVFISLSES